MSQHNASTPASRHATYNSNKQTWQTLEQKLDALLAYTQQLELTNATLAQQLSKSEDEKRKLAYEYTVIRHQIEQITQQMHSIEGKTRDV